MRLHAIESGERAIGLGLKVEDLIAVEDYATKLRHGLVDSADELDQKNLKRPVINNEQLEKLTFELERIHHEAHESREGLRKAENDLSRIQDENRALESVIREISLTLIRTRGQTEISQSERAFPSILKLVKMLESKEKKTRAMDLKGASAAEDVLEMNLALRDELSEARAGLERAERDLYLQKSELEKSILDCAKYKEKSEQPRKRLLFLPADLALGTVYDYSALVEQLIECLLDLQVKDKELAENKKSLDQYHVIST